MNQVTPDAIMRQARGEPASQAAGVEHSRAVAEVQAAVAVAQRCPRNEAQALARALESCGTMEVAESAFFKFPRGGATVAGESIHLATELARCWGNISYGIMELARDDERHVSEMLAFAWDMEANAQSRQTFLVPHKRDKRGGPELLIDMRDIYENNANNGARRLRECIFRVLPPYLKEQAKTRCYETLEKGQGSTPLPTLIMHAIAAFEKIGVSKDRLEAKFGPSAGWSKADIAALQVSIRSINRREVSADEEFPRNGTEDVTAKARQLTQAAAKAPHPAIEKAGAIKVAAEAAQTEADFAAVEQEAAAHRDAIEAHDADLAAQVDAAITAAERRIKSKGE